MGVCMCPQLSIVQNWVAIMCDLNCMHQGIGLARTFKVCDCYRMLDLNHSQTWIFTELCESPSGERPNPTSVTYTCQSVHVQSCKKTGEFVCFGTQSHAASALQAGAYLSYQDMSFVKELAIARRDCKGETIALQLGYHVGDVFALQDNDVGKLVGLELI